MDRFDLAVVGGGPAGLQAALKGALLHKRVVLFDKGRKFSRIFFAPRVANIPGTVEPPRGSELIKDGYAALARVNEELGEKVTIHEKTVVAKAERSGDGFLLTPDGSEPVWAKVLILGTGVVDRQPWITPEERNIAPILPFANKGLVEYCLLCDGHTVVGKRIVVIGADPSALGIAKTLRDGFEAEVTVAQCIACATGEPGHDHESKDHQALMARIEDAGFPVLDINLKGVEGFKEDKVVLVDSEGGRHTFEKAFLSFGWYKVNNELALQLGAEPSRAGYLFTDEDCQVLAGRDGEPLGGVYAIGDIRYETWNQVPSAWADAETAVIHAWGEQLPG